MKWWEKAILLAALVTFSIGVAWLWPLDTWSFGWWMRTVIIGVVLGFLLGILDLWVVRKRRARREIPSVDPLDPYGDGTIRKGDPLHDLFMKSVEDGYAIGHIDERGELTIEEKK